MPETNWLLYLKYRDESKGKGPVGLLYEAVNIPQLRLIEVVDVVVPGNDVGTHPLQT
jgi:hypothetical protein